ncbi:MAG: Ig-like domain-containing protein, partial [Kangiellaceae bacterium]|nr:Ig-like domain-containing protein [Kangiellaceae bacterium]
MMDLNLRILLLLTVLVGLSACGGGSNSSGNNNQNTEPQAVDDSGEVVLGRTIVIDVLANDSDADGDALVISSVDTPASGSASINSGQIEYLAPRDFVGEVAFSYSISDGNGGNASAQIVLSVLPRAISLNTSVPASYGAAVEVTLTAGEYTASGQTNSDGEAVIDFELSDISGNQNVY